MRPIDADIFTKGLLQLELADEVKVPRELELIIFKVNGSTKAYFYNYVGNRPVCIRIRIREYIRTL